MMADENYGPARANLRRLLELRRFRRSSQAICLGDEAEDLWFAKLPESAN